MVELLSGFPSYVAAYRASGVVNPREYETIVMNKVNEVAREYGMINLLFRLETDLGNYSVGALFKYLKISFRHFFRWNRMAIVSDQGWVRKGYKILSPLVHGQIRGYRLAEFEKARQWVSADPRKKKNMNMRSKDII